MRVLMLLFSSLILVAQETSKPDLISLHLEYSQKNGLSGPSGIGDFAIGSMQASLGAAGIMQSMNSMGEMLDSIFQGKQVQIPKTTGELIRKTMSSAASELTATLPRSSGYNVVLEATLRWNEEKKAYLVEKGTMEWDARNNSRVNAGGHLLFSNLKAKGTHTLTPEEVIVKFSGERMSDSLGADPKDPGNYTYTLKVNLKPKGVPVSGESGWIVEGGKIFHVKAKYSDAAVNTRGTEKYVPNASGNDLVASGEKEWSKEKPLIFSQGVAYEAEEREVKDGSATFSETWRDPTGAQTSISWDFDKSFKMRYGPTALDVAALVYRGSAVDPHVYNGRAKNVAGEDWTVHANFAGQVWVDGEKQVKLNLGAMEPDSKDVFRRVTSKFKIERYCRTWSNVEGTHVWEFDSRDPIDDWIDCPAAKKNQLPPPEWNGWVLDEFLVQVKDRPEFGAYYAAFRIELRENAYWICYSTPKRLSKKEYDRIKNSSKPEDLCGFTDSNMNDWIQLTQDPISKEWHSSLNTPPTGSK